MGATSKPKAKVNPFIGKAKPKGKANVKGKADGQGQDQAQPQRTVSSSGAGSKCILGRNSIQPSRPLGKLVHKLSSTFFLKALVARNPEKHTPLMKH